MTDLGLSVQRDFSSFVVDDAAQDHHITLLVEGASCGGCIKKIEGALLSQAPVTHARLNLSTGRLRIDWQGSADLASQWADAVEALGYSVAPYDEGEKLSVEAQHERRLLKALAVAGFGAMNIMLMSVAMWSGAAETQSTRALFHLMSALIAVPVTAYAGWPFFSSAWNALRHRTTNMDVPISLAVLLAVGLSLVQIVQGSHHVWFESATMLLFFLLIGRLLDARARGKARSTVDRLLALRSVDAQIFLADGTLKTVPARAIAPGDALFVPTGASVPVDGTVLTGDTELDTALITGESAPRRAQQGDAIFAGMVNLGPAIRLRADKVEDDTLVADITRMMEVAEQRRGQLVMLADRVAKAYVPVVHSLALIAFVVWWGVMGTSLTHALEITIAVLVITCPCALALAVPVVQVLAATRLMKKGILLKSANALERLAEVDLIAFDKTGTLTTPVPEADLRGLSGEEIKIAASLAQASTHPLARALAKSFPSTPLAIEATETIGSGVEATIDGKLARLGRYDWVCGDGARINADVPTLWLKVGDARALAIPFTDHLRDGTEETINWLRNRDYDMTLLSGDHAKAVRGVAGKLHIPNWQAPMRPDDKVRWLEHQSEDGRKALMVGDGLNDGPALAAAHVSASPASGSDLAQITADIVFQGTRLTAIPIVLQTAKRAALLVRQNITLALCYNAIAIPLAMAGYITPLWAAVSMSASSLLVTANAFRVQTRERGME